MIDCTNGANSIAALRLAGAENLRRKILIQVGNPLDCSKGMPPTLTVCNTDPLGEQTQREFPDVRVVKALNTVNCDIMIAPSRVPGDHELFVCGNDAAANREGSATSLISATSLTLPERKCSSLSGCDCGASSATRTSSSTSCAERESRCRSSACLHA